MAKRTGMSPPATKADLDQLAGVLRGEMAELRTELRTELRSLRTELKGDIAGLRGDLEHFKVEVRESFATKRDLEQWGGMLYDQIQARVANSERTIIAEVGREVARHVRAAQEATRAQIAALDDKYRDMSGRVSHLEELAGVEREPR